MYIFPLFSGNHSLLISLFNRNTRSRATARLFFTPQSPLLPRPLRNPQTNLNPSPKPSPIPTNNCRRRRVRASASAHRATQKLLHCRVLTRRTTLCNRRQAIRMSAGRLAHPESLLRIRECLQFRERLCALKRWPHLLKWHAPRWHRSLQLRLPKQQPSRPPVKGLSHRCRSCPPSMQRRSRV